MKVLEKIPLSEVWKLRQMVMWPDKDIDYIKVKGDENAVHYGIKIENQLISVISLFYNNNEVQFRKFATLKEYQNKGYGTELLNFIFNEANRNNIKRIFCNARKEKVNFYKKFGMKETLETFSKDGKEYIILEKILK